MTVSHRHSFVGFGWPMERGSYKSWMLEFHDDHGKKDTWEANHWMHICLAYQKREGRVKVIKVSLLISCDVLLPEACC